MDRNCSPNEVCLWRPVALCAGGKLGAADPYWKPTHQSYRMEETSRKVKGQGKYPYRAVDSAGQTMDILLTARPDAAAAKRFFQKVWSCNSNPIPRVLNVDKNPAYPAACHALP